MCIMNKHLLSNVSFLNNKGYLKLPDSLHFKKHNTVAIVTSTSITTDGMELLYSIFLMTCKMQKQAAFSRVVSAHLVKILAFKITNPNMPTESLNCYNIYCKTLPILTDMPCRLRGNYVGITLLKLNSTH